MTSYAFVIRETYVMSELNQPQIIGIIHSRR